MINSRLLWYVIIASLFFILLIVKLFEVQIIQNEESMFYAKRQQNRSELIKAERGLIYDRNGVMLVYNRNDISFYLDKANISAKERLAVAKKLSSFFKNKPSHYIKLMKEKSNTVCLEKKTASEKGLLLNNLGLPALYYLEDPTRIYHYNNLASHVIGYVDDQLNGVDGIESYFNTELKGENGIRLVERSAGGRMITVKEKETKPANPGSNIQLTIDKKVQTILEEELKRGIDKYQAESAVGIIMNPNNGEIIAMTSLGDYNPNTYSEFSDFNRKNRAITDVYEPGSTMKSICLASLFDQNLCSENEKINVENGIYKFRDKIIRDTHKHSLLTVKGILEQSSNIGMSKLIQRLDDEMLYKYLRGFGFGTFTGIELPGEVKGSLTKPNQWSLVSKAFLSFGYEISVTPLQMISAYSALINGGILYQPQIVKRLLYSSNEVKYEYQPREVRRVISTRTSKLMRNFLVSAVKNGTGKSADLDLVEVGGKTGTSKILENGRYSQSKYNSSFIGFFPAENPQAVCLILLIAPKIGGYGGVVAAPIFKEIVARIITTAEESIKNEKPKDVEDVKFLKAKNYFSKQSEKNKNIYSSSATNSENQKIMPDLKNMSINEGLTIIKRLGLKFKVFGSGNITSQSIQPGSLVEEGDLCKITCSDNNKKLVPN